jgi:uncharacterized protein
MKFSQFNTIIPFEEKYALYNSFTQKVIFLVAELKELLSAAINEGIDNLNEYHPTFYQYIIEQGFVVEESCDEVAIVKEISEKIDNSPQDFLLTINPTMNCNFKCWYCYETHVKKSKLNVDTLEKTKRFIHKTVNENEELKTFSLSFFGGEPLLYFKETVVPIIDYAKEVCSKKNVDFTIGFTTNGYLINQSFIDYFKELGMSCFLQITLDGYKEEHDAVRFVNAKRGSYEEIVKNIRLLINNKFPVQLRVNYTDKNIANSHKIANEFEDIDKAILDNYLIFDFHRVWQNTSAGDVSEIVEENLLSIRKNGLTVKTNSPNSVVDSCYADKRNSVVINYNADIYKCTARDFTSQNRAGYVNDEGCLVWENDYQEKRMSVKFKNKPCLTCRIMPLCNGGCSQHAFERQDEEYCIYDGDETEKSNIVKIKIEDILRKAQVKETV